MGLQQEWHPRPGDRVVRHPRKVEIGPLRIEGSPRRVPPRNFGSISFLVGGFSALIGVGTLLLLLPFTNTHGGMTPFMDALFTAASAVTVTGLVVVDTPTYWSFSGQLIIMILIFIGGLGIITGATFLLIMTGQRITLVNRLLMRESLGVDQLGGLIVLTKRVVFVVGVIQVVGFLILSALLLNDYPFATALWQAGFHTVTSFNNAGFTILPDSQSLSALQQDLWLLTPIILLIIFGGLGYGVPVDMFRHRRFSRFTLDTKLVITLSLALWVIGTLVILMSEYSNTATLGPMSLGVKTLNAAFYSISSRTAGFDTVDFGGMRQHTGLFITALKFIGAASASTAGGIKVNTVAVLLAACTSSLKGNPHVTAFGREISPSQVYRAVTMLVLGLTLVLSLAFFLTLSEGFPFIQTLFETVSAFGTVGLSLGITPELSTMGRLIIILTMFLGRVGPLSLALALAEKEQAAPYRYAEERVKIG